MAIRKRKGRASPYQVYWNNPFTEKRESMSFVTLAEARKVESLIKHRLEFDRESFRPQDDDTHTGGTVGEILTLYLAAKKMAGINLKNTLYHLKPVSAAFSRKDVSNLDRRDIVIFMTEQAKANVRQLTIHRRLSILRAALAWAVESDLIVSNPLVGMKIPKGKPERIAPPTVSEFYALLSAAPGHLQRAILLGISLGVRAGPSELFSLQWKDVDIARKIIRVWSANKNPNRPYRDIPLRNDLVDSLKAWMLEDGTLLPKTIVHYRGKQINSIKTAWKKCKQDAHITRRLRPYDLRHAFATYALDAGADIQAVADTMGHSDISMVLKHYQHGKEEARRAAVESLPDLSSHVPKACAQAKKGLQN